MTLFKWQTVLLGPSVEPCQVLPLQPKVHLGAVAMNYWSLTIRCNLVSCLGHLLGESYPSAEIQLAYSIAPADWAESALNGETKKSLLVCSIFTGCLVLLTLCWTKLRRSNDLSFNHAVLQLNNCMFVFSIWIFRNLGSVFRLVCVSAQSHTVITDYTVDVKKRDNMATHSPFSLLIKRTLKKCKDNLRLCDEKWQKVRSTWE